MSDASESPDPSPADATANLQTEGTWEEGRLAAILMRLLGVYFLGWAVISGVDEAVRLLIASNKYGLREMFPSHWTYLANIAATFAVGAYLLVGGRWVFEKVLAPMVPDSSEDDLDYEASDDQPGTDNSSSGKTE
jgi:hypothetical protein